MHSLEPGRHWDDSKCDYGTVAGGAVAVWGYNGGQRRDDRWDASTCVADGHSLGNGILHGLINSVLNGGHADAFWDRYVYSSRFRKTRRC